MDPNTVVSIVVPIQQDAHIIEEIVTEIDQVVGTSYRFFEIVLVDDGSTDGTAAAVQPLLKKIQRVRYLRLSRPFGPDVAMSAGIESAIGDVVVTLDPRIDPIGVIPTMIELCRKSGGIVHGMAENPVHRSFIRDWLGGRFRDYCRKHIGVDIKRGVSDFRVMSRQAVNALLQVREQSRYLRVLTLTLGYQHDFFPYTIAPRKGGPRVTTWHGEIATAIDLLAANTRHPLRMVTAAGLLGAFLNLLYAVYVVAIFLTKPTVAEGWTTLSLQLSGMFFFVCLILAVLSEYVGTILGEVRSRPLYFVAQEANSSVLLEDTVQSSIVKESVGTSVGI
ncbi:MAG: glycosyltransferase [Verrucomicrobiota bacterium]